MSDLFALGATHAARTRTLHTSCSGAIPAQHRTTRSVPRRLTSAAFDGGDDARYRAAKRSSAGELPPEPQRPAKEREGWKPGVVVEALARGGELLAGTSHMRAARIMNHSTSAR